jgi:glycosyltransferase A (GT-A) superfamily protein (DUF2064 family)
MRRMCDVLWVVEPRGNGRASTQHSTAGRCQWVLGPALPGGIAVCGMRQNAPMQEHGLSCGWSKLCAVVSHSPHASGAAEDSC